MEDGELIKKIEELEKVNRLLDSRILELYTLYNITKRLSLTTQLDEIFNGTMDLISTSLRIDDFCVILFDENLENLVVRSCHSDADLYDISFEMGEGITGKAVAEGNSRLIQDVSKCEDFLFYKGKKKNIGSFLTIPLKGKSGDPIGALNVHKEEIYSFNEEDITLFNEVAQQIAIAIDKALSFKNIQELSFRDELTGLYNRRYFFEYFEREIDRSKRYGHSISLVMLDIDHFKNFNDRNGHLLGDEALRAVSRVLEKVLRRSDVVARYGGEEFVVILPETDKAMAISVAEKMRVAIEGETVEGEENQPGGRLTATFGVSSLPDDAGFASEMIDCADKALYRGKIQQRNIVMPSGAIAPSSAGAVT